ncbi:hypothetical protein BDF14DRAFT_1832697 [Spinellus fusiger]|nr:hypothetical protein BDF14DRAFT_1832697 [Spinellus fusiger]
MSGKKKVQKMSLSDFLADDSKGSWADEMADLPTAPSAAERPSRGLGGGGGFDRERDFESSHRGGGEGGDRFGSRFGNDRGASGYTPRAPVALPTSAPFTAHIANLSFDASEDDLSNFFGKMKIANIRILRDRDENSKGFGYVEFDDLDSLKGALELSGESLHNRNIRVNVAEPPKERTDRPERGPDRTDVSTWRRTGPVESRDPPRREFGNREARPQDRERSFFDRRGDTSWGGGSSGFARNNRQESAPAERPRLNLKPRTVETVSSADDAHGSSKPSPFGAAKPVNTEDALKRIEEKISGKQ